MVVGSKVNTDAPGIGREGAQIRLITNANLTPGRVRPGEAASASNNPQGHLVDSVVMMKSNILPEKGDFNLLGKLFMYYFGFENSRIFMLSSTCPSF